MPTRLESSTARGDWKGVEWGVGGFNGIDGDIWMEMSARPQIFRADVLPVFRRPASASLRPSLPSRVHSLKLGLTNYRFDFRKKKKKWFFFVSIRWSGFCWLLISYCFLSLLIHCKKKLVDEDWSNLIAFDNVANGRLLMLHRTPFLIKHSALINQQKFTRWLTIELQSMFRFSKEIYFGKPISFVTLVSSPWKNVFI